MTKAADPFYNRKPVPGRYHPWLSKHFSTVSLTDFCSDSLIKDVGITGLSPEEEFWNREKKYTANGADVRRFSKSLDGGAEPLNDPYYGRKPVSSELQHRFRRQSLTNNFSRSRNHGCWVNRSIS